MGPETPRQELSYQCEPANSCESLHSAQIRFPHRVRTEFCGRDPAGGLGFTAGHTGHMHLISLVANLRLKQPEASRNLARQD